MDGPSARAALGLSTDASRQDIKHAYRARAKAMHPDRGGDGRAFGLLTAAYELALEVVPPPGVRHPFLAAPPTTASPPRPRRSFAEELHLAMAH